MRILRKGPFQHCPGAASSPWHGREMHQHESVLEHLTDFLVLLPGVRGHIAAHREGVFQGYTGLTMGCLGIPKAEKGIELGCLGRKNACENTGMKRTGHV